jgi:galactoside O-acetyltransferase
MGRVDVTTIGLGSVGTNVRIHDLTRITEPECIALGDEVVIDDFVFVQGGDGLDVGAYVHIAAFASIMGGGRSKIGDFTGISQGARVLTGTDLPDGSGLLGPAIPAEFRSVTRPGVVLERFVLIGANAVVHPGVTVGEGAVIGSNALVLHDVEPWTINVGSPCRAIKVRPRERMLEYARLLTGSDYGFESRSR